MEMQQEEKVRLWPKAIDQARSMAASHIARYEFARPAVQGKRLCDIACGAGYGSCFLSQYAKSVVGIDISASAIEWAKEYFQNNKKNRRSQCLCVFKGTDWQVFRNQRFFTCHSVHKRIHRNKASRLSTDESVFNET